MKRAPNNITTILVFLLVITLMIASSLMPAPVRAFGTSSDDAVAVTPTPDENRAVKQLISVEGGQITATAADGTRFTLVVPPRALLSNLEITMTPVAQVEQLPLSGGLVAAVQLEPEGLLLWEPASLTIEPATAFPVSQQLSFTWHDKGEGFHTYPLQIDPSSITMSIVHFSGYGVGSGTDAEGDSSSPPGEQERLESNTEKLTRSERKYRDQNRNLTKKQLKKRNRNLCSNFNQQVVRFFEILKRQLDEALSSRDEAKLRCLLAVSLKWERFAGIEQAFAGCLPESLSADAEILANFRLKALEILADKAYQRCGEHKPAEAIRLLSLEKQARQYSTRYADGVVEFLFTQLADRIAEKAKKCARFELQFDSTVNILAEGLDGNATFDGHVRATVQIQYEPGKKLVAEGPLEYLSFSTSPCTVVNFSGSTFHIYDLGLDLNLRDNNDCGGGNDSDATVVSMTIFDGVPRESIDCDEDNLPNAGFWSAGFLELHRSEVEEDSSGYRYVIRGWSKGSDDLLARRTYQQSKKRVFAPAVETFSEKTTFELFHRPE